MPIDLHTLLIVSEITSSYGGGQVYIKNLLKGFLTEGVIPSVLSIVRVSQETAAIKFIHYLTIRVDIWELPQSWSSEKIDRFWADHFFSYCNANEVGLIHAHAWKEEALIAGKRIGIPVVITAHHGGIICPAGTLLNWRDGICELPVSDRNCLRCVCRTIPGNMIWFSILRLIPLKIRLATANFLQKKRFVPFLTPVFTASNAIQSKLNIIEALKNAACIIAPCDKMRESFERNGVHGNVIVLPHGIPELEKKTLPLCAKPIRFFYLGRINYVKGLHVMLEAFQRIPTTDYELHIIGEGVTKSEKRYWNRLKKKAAHLNVIWHGKIAHEHILEMIQQYHVMIHPTICLEIYGLNITESLSLGRPVLATRCGGAEMQIRDGENGWLISPNNINELHETIVHILQNPQEIIQYAKQCTKSPFDKYIHDLICKYKGLGCDIYHSREIIPE